MHIQIAKPQEGEFSPVFLMLILHLFRRNKTIYLTLDGA